MSKHWLVPGNSFEKNISLYIGGWTKDHSFNFWNNTSEKAYLTKQEYDFLDDFLMLLLSMSLSILDTSHSDIDSSPILMILSTERKVSNNQSACCYI